MEDFLMRGDAPLSAEEWATLDRVVVETAKKLLVGRRLIEIFGPLGADFQTVTVNQYHVTGACLHAGDGDCCGEGDECCGEGGGCCGGDCDPVDVAKRTIVELPFLHKDFVMQWRDMAQAKQFGWPLDISPAAASAAMVARKEDEMIFGGLFAQAGTKAKAASWQEPGSVFATLVEASAALAEKGFFGPYAVVVSPAVYAQMHRPMKGGMGMLEIKQVKELASGGVYQTPALKGNQALMISQGVQNLDLAVAQDLVTAYLGPDKMEHVFRAMESLALRVKRPDAIYAIE